MKRPSPTRTLNPLHFEDMEPHRFEDLVRQLAHGFRTWRSIEATGRKGKDAGVDIRAFEMVLDQSAPDDSEERVQLAPDREWRIQVKRQKALGPADLVAIVEDAVPDAGPAPYGFIIAAACDVSAQAMADFRTAAASRGIREFLLWTNAHLEDLLFLPENDHLLFAYFGISIQTRIRSQLTAVRSTISIKRKLRSALKIDPARHSGRGWVLIRDIDDMSYPDMAVARAHARDRAAPWHPAEIIGFYGRVLLVERFSFEGTVEADDSWSYREDSRTTIPHFGHGYWDEVDPDRRRRVDVPINDPVRKRIFEVSLLPYENVLEVDPFGDSHLDAPHVFCRFSGPEGPYADDRGRTLAISTGGASLRQLDPAKMKAAPAAPVEEAGIATPAAKRRARGPKPPTE